jgi:hypothetical protein
MSPAASSAYPTRIPPLGTSGEMATRLASRAPAASGAASPSPSASALRNSRTPTALSMSGSAPHRSCASTPGRPSASSRTGPSAASVPPSPGGSSGGRTTGAHGPYAGSPEMKRPGAPRRAHRAASHTSTQGATPSPAGAARTAGCRRGGSSRARSACRCGTPP